MGTFILKAPMKLKPTTHAKSQIAKNFYLKGKNFIIAAILLRQYRGNEYIVLHLLCQGIEIVLKALLLLKNFDAYNPRMKRNKKNCGFGHDLESLSTEVLSQFGLKPLRPALATELNKLNILYSNHLLRYYSPYDVLVDPSTIQSDLVLMRIRAAIRLTDAINR